MKSKTILASLAMFLAGFALCMASDLNMGTWKLNEAKSKFSPGAVRNNTVVYESAGDSVKVTVDGVDSEGKPAHSEWTGKFDGKDYPLVGDPDADTRAYKTVDARTTNLVNKKAGKVTATGQIVIAADGKSRVLTVDQTDAAGKKVTSTFVYDKQ